MARILNVQHWDAVFEYDSAPFFARRGDLVDRALIFAGQAAPDPRNYDLVTINGGYMNAYDERASPWIPRELGFIEDCLKTGTPLLAICLGSQLLARVLGARAYRSPAPEFGFKRLRLNNEGKADSVIGALGDEEGSFLAIEWHDDAWDLPAGAQLLASSEAWPNQAFRYGPDALAIQFHLEFTQEHMAWAVARPGVARSADPEAEDPAAFASPSPRYEELKDNMEKILSGLLKGE